MTRTKKVFLALVAASALGGFLGGVLAVDASTLLKEIGTWYYARYLAPAVIFDNIKCDRCDMSTEWLQGNDMSAQVYNELQFLRVDKMLEPRVFTKGDLLELCNGAKCAVYVFNGRIIGGKPWTLAKPYYKDTYTKYRNVSFHTVDPADPTSDMIAKQWAVNYQNSYVNTVEQTGSVYFPREIYCPSDNCRYAQVEYADFRSRIELTDTIVMFGLSPVPASSDILLHTNTKNY